MNVLLFYIKKIFFSILIIMLISWVHPLDGIASGVLLTLVPYGIEGSTQVYSSDLTDNFNSSMFISSITITDDGDAIGGGPGIFSGFDVDALFLDRDGDLNTTSDRIFPASYSFIAGSTRPTSNPGYLPDAAHPGPTFGALDATTIDYATATLNSIDAILGDNTVADGELCLGDGGELTAFFSPWAPIGHHLYLFLGEVGTTANAEYAAISATAQVPGPATILLLASGLAAMGIWRRRNC
jgi:hypothetical protein